LIIAVGVLKFENPLGAFPGDCALPLRRLEKEKRRMGYAYPQTPI